MPFRCLISVNTDALFIVENLTLGAIRRQNTLIVPPVHRLLASDFHRFAHTRLWVILLVSFLATALVRKTIGLRLITNALELVSAEGLSFGTLNTLVVLSEFGRITGDLKVLVVKLTLPARRVYLHLRVCALTMEKLVVKNLTVPARGKHALVVAVEKRVVTIDFLLRTHALRSDQAVDLT